MGCGCDLKYFHNGFTGNDILLDTKLREALSTYKMINRKAYNAGDLLEIMKYFSCVDSDVFFGAFRNIGIDLQPGDLVQFASVVEQGGDLQGWINGRNGQPVYFDARKMMREMVFSPEKVRNSQCTIDYY